MLDGQGGASRRRFMIAAAAAAVGGTAPAAASGNPQNQPPNLPEWGRTLGPGVIEEPYGARSAHEAHVVRRYVPWLTPDRTSSVSFTPLQDMHGIITPSGLHFERHHGGVPDVNPDDWRLMLHGMVERPLVFTLMPSGLSRQFTFVNEVNSVITNPCPERPLHGRPGFVEIGGLAWSGAGAISRVDVSVDGGDNWRTAELQPPVLDKACTRFRIPWEWREGERAFLQSRAIDETGRVQPSIQALRAARGVESIYHRNAVQTWLVEPDGTVVNVQIDG